MRTIFNGMLVFCVISALGLIGLLSGLNSSDGGTAAGFALFAIFAVILLGWLLVMTVGAAIGRTFAHIRADAIPNSASQDAPPGPLGRLGRKGHWIGIAVAGLGLAAAVATTVWDTTAIRHAGSGFGLGGFLLMSLKMTVWAMPGMGILLLASVLTWLDPVFRRRSADQAQVRRRPAAEGMSPSP